ncbi:PQQ-dependent sugar dehydrogenase [Stackebrandtia nassauensis]|uniref:PKD domain containing protein n=1 Tax=Stackebrandtia nassauensis (strain DSM 44728 / CIP 108903 / NRRL B-16338 / NBRC 102104 / LLR-40K-21) TaxID=446470 RepID=D3Q9F8_STANL|nr:PQQ-dependent sugar dehydrogenase [Stackebrandtia nassauensis]ADD42640.1 PKD domain containing protein [Stackebrandtia nassauensis DSM 44728]
MFKRIAFAIVILLTSATLTASTATAAPPADFDKTLISDGLNVPTAFRFASGGRILVAEKDGAIRLIVNGVLRADPMITLSTAGADERGLLGLELDPAFDTNGYVYVGYTHTDNRNRLSRFTATGSTIDPGSELVLLQSDQESNVFHHGGEIRFAPDGTLYWSLGMNTINVNSEQLGNLHGKIHRINPDGTIPGDNPFAGVPGAEPSIWAYGLRNPFRFDLIGSGPNAGRLLSGDVGGSAWEEINLIERGANYGWPKAEGLCDGCPYAQPVHTYPHTAPPASAGSITSVEIYTGGQFGSQYDNAVFFADYTLGFIKYLKMDDEFRSVISVNDFDTAAGTPVQLTTGPDGALYQLNIYPGELYRIAPSGGNRAPEAKAAASPDNGLAPLRVRFSSAGSDDPDNDPISYRWDFGDGTTSTRANPSHTFFRNGKYQVKLTVSDGTKTDTATVPVQVGNRRPSATITAPADGFKYDAGDTISFAGTGTDPEDGRLGPASMSWTVMFHHADHVHPFLGPVDGVASGEFTIPRAPDNLANTWYRIHLKVTDSGGLTRSTYVDVKPNLVTLTVKTGTPGLSFTVDGIPHNGTLTETAVVGVERTLDVPPLQYANDTRYQFASWSDGGDAAHTIVTPERDTVYTVDFTELPRPPDPWVETNVGARTQDGWASYKDGEFTVNGSGWDIWDTTDEFHYANRPLSGDGRITARLTSQTDTDDWAKAGVMIKESTQAGARYAAVAVTPDNGVRMQANFNEDDGGFAYQPGNAWLRLTRSGDTFTAETSDDGTNWTRIGTTTLTMAKDVTIGLFSTAHDNTEFSKAVFDSVDVSGVPGPVPEPWTCGDVGDPRLPGSAAHENGTFTITGAGDDIWATSDQFHYCHRQLDGDGRITARVTGQADTDDWAKTGVMMKQSTQAGSPYVAAFVTPEHGVRTQTGFDTDTAGTQTGTPAWVRLERVGDTVTAYESPDGQQWTAIATATLSGPVTVGLFVTSHNGSVPNTSTLDSVDVDGPAEVEASLHNGMTSGSREDQGCGPLIFGP